ncbi:hypothetical protein RZS08_03855, partial [Arthrospira platensis SPKY1]|nr:hypothetical protein [Arthrospira platensis SPKY1]
VVEPEGDFVTRTDAQLVAQVLRDDDLTFRPHTMSHTIEYNLIAGGREVAEDVGGRVPHSWLTQRSTRANIGYRQRGVDGANHQFTARFPRSQVCRPVEELPFPKLNTG